MTSIEDDLKELTHLNEIHDDEKESKKRSKKKIWVAAGSIFISLLMLSFIFLNYPVYSALINWLRSDSPSENILETHGFRIKFTGETLNQLKQAWKDNPYRETALCLRGKADGNTFRIASVYEPVIYEQSARHVIHAPCDPGTTVLIFHTQPYKRCIASQTDMRTLEHVQERNPDVGMMIMCEENRFSIYK
ncbi:MAG: hypothetical protein ACOC32_04330 [Nanoarchaeota archaeon]